ncbi:MAG: PIN domain-containing protein [Lentisphaerae bacterium]|nr:PIN domain-containing protein [Lentisphaerota bacterium]MBT4819119.1 PIN domain-containing protein [Lentisphaerota bacterium]MBT5606658.1 PIN domain-containing protein [Lentisphaerota bacterium]MBT7057173.1 PIN domain-containing protein [Lentisphaerota bacterium]MBT7847064.1 PIN domain-containing protein [Lentisphaerota bacterium]
MSQRTIIDTSVWIEVMRHRDPALKASIKALIEAQAAYCSGIIVAELLSGTRTQREFREVLEVVLGLDVLSDTPEICVEAGRIAFDLRRQGLTIPLADTLIIAQARTHDLAILSLDQHFQRVRDTLDLRLVEV